VCREPASSETVGLWPRRPQRRRVPLGPACYIRAMAGMLSLEREGTRLSALSWGGGSPAVLLLHGLAGYAGEWSETADCLGGNGRVVAVDARGHGGSERIPRHLSLSAQVDDAAYLIKRLGLGRCVVVGQSFGGVIAMLLAARHPDLLRGLVVVEATPMTPDAAAIERVRRWLAVWPVPFAGRMLGKSEGRTFWGEWASIRCPTLIVRGEDGTMPDEDVTRMLTLPHARLEVVVGAGHDVHLEEPGRWCELLEAFLLSFAPP
jgi:pimeloyl-ACP methyl ester carboxylesterase